MINLKACPKCKSNKISITGFSFVYEMKVQCDECKYCTEYYEIEMDTDETKDMLTERVAGIWNNIPRDK